MVLHHFSSNFVLFAFYTASVLIFLYLPIVCVCVCVCVCEARPGAPITSVHTEFAVWISYQYVLFLNSEEISAEGFALLHHSNWMQVRSYQVSRCT